MLPGAGAERLPALGGVDALEADAVLGTRGVEDGDGIPISYADDPAPDDVGARERCERAEQREGCERPACRAGGVSLSHHFNAFLP